MSNPETSSTSEPFAVFKTWKDCLKALREEYACMVEKKQQEFIQRVERSASNKLLAFECLRWLPHAKDGKNYRWLFEPMNMVLGAGSEPPHLALLENPILVDKWVNDQIKPLDSIAAWDAFLASGRHLWVLHCLFQCRGKREFFVAGLKALANGLACWQNLRAPKTWKTGGVDPTDVRWIAQLLEPLIQAKFEISKEFTVAVYAVAAVTELSSSVRLDLQTVWKQLTTTRAERDEEVAARHAAEATADEIRLDLERTHQELVRCRQDLEEERNHTVRSRGFSEVARKETVQQVLSDVRQGINHRLEDIRNYADREKPNREEILELVKEIEDHLSKLETRLQP